MRDVVLLLPVRRLAFPHNGGLQCKVPAWREKKKKRRVTASSAVGKATVRSPKTVWKRRCGTSLMKVHFGEVHLIDKMNSCIHS